LSLLGTFFFQCLPSSQNPFWFCWVLPKLNSLLSARRRLSDFFTMLQAAAIVVFPFYIWRRDKSSFSLSWAGGVLISLLRQTASVNASHLPSTETESSHRRHDSKWIKMKKRKINCSLDWARSLVIWVCPPVERLFTANKPGPLLGTLFTVQTNLVINALAVGFELGCI
jgi:hypothetical protein